MNYELFVIPRLTRDLLKLSGDCVSSL